jgi:gliding motility-associated-like protein
MKKLFSFAFSAFCLVSVLLVHEQVHGQINIMPGPAVTPVMMVENIVGEGITFDNVSFQGANVSRGIFTNGQTTNLGIASGIFLTSGSGFNIPGPNTTGSAGTNNGTPGHPLLTAITTTATYDAAVLSFDFVPESDTMRFRYVFGSEEYHEWVGSSYNDVFGYFVSGPNPMGGNYTNKNIAIIPGTTNTSVAINNVNNGYAPNGTAPTGPCMNCAYFNDNTGGLTLQYDGKTVVLIAWVLVVPCETYHIKIGVADAGDGIYDTGVFIEENSFESPKIDVELEPYPAGVSETMIEGCVWAEVIFTLPDASYAPVTICFDIQGTATNGLDYEFIDNCITFEEGQDTAIVNIVPLRDSIIEGDETIILIIENILGCIVRYDTITFIITDYIDMVTVASPNTAICAGMETQLHVKVFNGIPPYTYEWEGLEFTTDTIIVTPDTTTTYYFQAIDMCLDTITDSIKVIVFPIPEVDLGPDSLYMCEGDTIILDAGPNGILGYFWQNGAGGQYHTVTEPGFYFVTIAGSGGCINSDSVYVFQTVIEIDIGPDTNICVGESVVFTAPDGFESYVWQDGTTGQSYTASETGYYKLEVTLNGCTKADSAYLFVDDPNIGVELGNDTTVCAGTSIVLAPSGIYNTYLWSTGATTPSITVTEPGTYTLFVTSTCGEAEGSIKVNHWPAADPNLGPDLNLCYGESALLNPGPSFVAYKWQDNSINPFYTVSQGGMYYVTVTTAYGCQGSDTVFVQIGSIVDLGIEDTLTLCEGETITLDAQSGFDFYTWSNGEYGTNTINVEEGGWYKIDVNYFYGCPSADSVYIDAYPIPEAIITGDDFLCEGDTIWLSAPEGNFDYTWNNQQTNQPNYMVVQGGTYSLKMSNVCGVDTDTKTIEVRPLPQPESALGPDITLKFGESITLDAGEGTSFAWSSEPEVYIENPASQQITVPGMEDPVEYMVYVMLNGCSAEGFKVVAMHPPNRVGVPTAFSPNGDGVNDELRVLGSGFSDMIFRIYNRYGQLVFETRDSTIGWDGTVNGVKQEMEVYTYHIRVVFQDSDVVEETGTVTLLR